MEFPTDGASAPASTVDDGARQGAVTVRCWGTRGSIPSPGPTTAAHGGNTPCLEIRVPGRRLILDAGSGMRLLGMSLVEEGEPLEASIFLTHFHWDHIQGFPFFAPLYRPEAKLRIVGPRQDGVDIESLFAGQMGPIYFPVPFEAVAAQTLFEHLNEGSWTDGDVRVSAMRVRHASWTVGYRVDVAGRSVCYIPDNELVGGDYPVGEGWRERLVEFVGDADVLVHDAMYTESEYPGKVGWGHSTFRHAMSLARDAGVEKLLFFHHAPERDDEQLDRLVDEARRIADEQGNGVELDAAREGSDFQV